MRITRAPNHGWDVGAGDNGDFKCGLRQEVRGAWPLIPGARTVGSLRWDTLTSWAGKRGGQGCDWAPSTPRGRNLGNEALGGGRAARCSPGACFFKLSNVGQLAVLEPVALCEKPRVLTGAGPPRAEADRPRGDGAV